MATKKILCPLMGCECIGDGGIKDGELVSCRFWVVVHGKHPQTGEELHTGDCAFAWTPVLLIENSKVNRETGAAVESLRNENVAIGQALLSVHANQPKLQRVINV